MKVNVGTPDRIVRIVVGLGLVGWAAFGGGPAWAYVGIVPILTGTFRICPLYSLVGINTCPNK